APAPGPVPGAAAADGEGPRLAGIRWSDPAGFTSRPPSMAMRAAEYVVPGEAGEGLMTVFHFPGMGGSVDGNIGRWVGQFTVADAPEPVMLRAQKTVAGLEVHLVDIRGTFASSMTGGPPTPGSRLLGAIVLGPEGPVFFKLVGPEATLEAAKPAFEAFIDTLGPAA
ncbi:MAG: hypothetical protein AAGH15_06920, partial [Myxococcota bacterium]